MKNKILSAVTILFIACNPFCLSTSPDLPMAENPEEDAIIQKAVLFSKDTPNELLGKDYALAKIKLDIDMSMPMTAPPHPADEIRKKIAKLEFLKFRVEKTPIESNSDEETKKSLLINLNEIIKFNKTKESDIESNFISELEASRIIKEIESDYEVLSGFPDFVSKEFNVLYKNKIEKIHTLKNEVKEKIKDASLPKNCKKLYQRQLKKLEESDANLYLKKQQLDDHIKSINDNISNKKTGFEKSKQFVLDMFSIGEYSEARKVIYEERDKVKTLKQDLEIGLKNLNLDQLPSSTDLDNSSKAL